MRLVVSADALLIPLLLSPESTTGLPTCGAWVKVGPPLSSSVPSSGLNGLADVPT